jgi:hypothetical protein
MTDGASLGCAVSKDQLANCFGLLREARAASELNDSVIYAVEKQSSSGHHDHLMRTIEALERELEFGPRVVSLSLHHHLNGVPPPHRLPRKDA